MLRFNRIYFLLTVVLIGVESFIGLCMHDPIIRPYVGDVLIVVLLYCLIRSWWDLPVVPLALGVLVFAYGEETLQYFHFADRLGFTRPSLMRTLIGTWFSWVDMGCYTIGIGMVLAAEMFFRQRHWKLAETKS
ncbi:MAG TPA: DUF2809 domain-containing protein [Puia sp.]|jgi:hypothetical protein|nr:DUF2809 domain-containing protein [Puia sp.]